MLRGSVDLSSLPSSGMEEHQGRVSSTQAIHFQERAFPSGFEDTWGGTNLGAVPHQLEDMNLVCHHSMTTTWTPTPHSVLHSFLFKLLCEGEQSPFKERCKASEFIPVPLTVQGTGCHLAVGLPWLDH